MKVLSKPQQDAMRKLWDSGFCIQPEYIYVHYSNIDAGTNPRDSVQIADDLTRHKLVNWVGNVGYLELTDLGREWYTSNQAEVGA
jgi:hypothetical protein